MGQRHKHADVIIAWAEGKDVQVWEEFSWRDVTVEAPTFMGEKYRIKPPAKKYKLALFDRHCETSFVKAANNEFETGEYEKSRNFIRWLTDWIEYEE